MLVLTRRAEQTIRIGRDITVTILRIQGRTVKVGIQAPSAMEVLRGELVAEQPLPQEGASRRAAPPAEIPSARSSRSRRAPRDLFPYVGDQVVGCRESLSADMARGSRLRRGIRSICTGLCGTMNSILWIGSQGLTRGLRSSDP